jgi:hypothetical protein
MVALILLLWSGFHQTEAIPYKPQNEFEVKFNITFKQRGVPDDYNIVRLNDSDSEREKRTSTTPLPYMTLTVKVLKVNSGEIKLKVIQDDNITVLRSKVEEGTEFGLTLGYADDLKDRVSGYKHVIYFFTAKKEIINQIIIEFDEDGTYFVNGDKRGKI